MSTEHYILAFYMLWTSYYLSCIHVQSDAHSYYNIGVKYYHVSLILDRLLCIIFYMIYLEFEPIMDFHMSETRLFRIKPWEKNYEIADLPPVSHFSHITYPYLSEMPVRIYYQELFILRILSISFTPYLGRISNAFSLFCFSHHLSSKAIWIFSNINNINLFRPDRYSNSLVTI